MKFPRWISAVIVLTLTIGATGCSKSADQSGLLPSYGKLKRIEAGQSFDYPDGPKPVVITDQKDLAKFENLLKASRLSVPKEVIVDRCVGYSANYINLDFENGKKAHLWYTSDACGHPAGNSNNMAVEVLFDSVYDG